MGVVSPIAALGVVVPVLAGLAKGERPAALQLVGIVVAVAGVVLASGPELSGRAGARPVLLAAVAAVGFGVALLAIAEGSQHSTLMTLVTMRLTSVTLLAVALVVALGRGTPRSEFALSPRDVGLVALVGLGDVGRQPQLRPGQPARRRERRRRCSARSTRSSPCCWPGACTASGSGGSSRPASRAPWPAWCSSPPAERALASCVASDGSGRGQPAQLSEQ